MNQKHAVILAGGRGTRLRPYTVVLPKPLMPIGEFPILEVIIRQLNLNGFTNITLAVNHQADLIKAYFGDGSKWNLSINYSLEHQALGTMAPLKLIKNLPDNFLVMNGDVLTDLNFNDFYNNHTKNNSLFTISSYKRKQLIDYGVLKSNDQKRLIDFVEKPNTEYEVSMGIYMLNNKILDFIPENAPYGFDTLMLSLLEKNVEININSFSGVWLDIGRPDDYIEAIEIFDKIKDRIINV